MLKRVAAIGLAGLALAVGGYVASAASQPFVAAHELCSAGYVSAIIGGEAKCLRAGEFCSPSYESDYEHYGFACVEGHLKGATTSTTPKAYGRTIEIDHIVSLEIGGRTTSPTSTRTRFRAGELSRQGQA